MAIKAVPLLSAKLLNYCFLIMIFHVVSFIFVTSSTPLFRFLATVGMVSHEGGLSSITSRVCPVPSCSNAFAV